MDCGKYRGSLHGYVSGSISEIESKAVKKHLEACDRCRQEIGEIRRMKTLLRESTGLIVPPVGLKRDIMASIDLGRYKKQVRSSLGELTNWGVSLVAAGLVLLFLNMVPAQDNTGEIRQDVKTATSNITKRIIQPVSFVGRELSDAARRLSELDGITGRIERQIKGGIE